jgi:ornithine carbamoyltransferase
VLRGSTRTRISFETALARSGAAAIVVGPQDLQLGRGGTIEDTARAFVIRSYSDAEVAPFQVDRRIMSLARPGATFMRCLPDHRGDEVSADVVDGPASVVFDQAENRLYTARAILAELIEGGLEGARCAS